MHHRPLYGVQNGSMMNSEPKSEPSGKSCARPVVGQSGSRELNFGRTAQCYVADVQSNPRMQLGKLPFYH
jgi:hypothetical protein